MLLTDDWEAEKSVGFSRVKAGEVVVDDNARGSTKKVFSSSISQKKIDLYFEQWEYKLTAST
jgi:hypothetical protein